MGCVLHAGNVGGKNPALPGKAGRGMEDAGLLYAAMPRGENTT